jgi:propanol-preferring alcohol dehydrogenase
VIPGHQVVGEVEALGPGAQDLSVGSRVGVAWLHSTDGTCRYCRRGRENLCESAAFTGWTVDGGYAERVLAPAAFVYPLPADFGDREAAPLLCAGIIGFRALRLSGLSDFRGARLGIYGFGAAGHVAIQIARGRGADVYVSTRDHAKHQTLAAEAGRRLGGRRGGGAARPARRRHRLRSRRRAGPRRTGRGGSRWHRGAGGHPP